MPEWTRVDKYNDIQEAFLLFLDGELNMVVEYFERYDFTPTTSMMFTNKFTIRYPLGYGSFCDLVRYSDLKNKLAFQQNLFSLTEIPCMSEYSNQLIEALEE